MAPVFSTFEIYLFAGGGCLLVGSFLNACIYRLPAGVSMLSVKRSFCPDCRQTISWWQNIPLLSFLLLRGRCYHCGQSISIRYPIVELLSLLLGLLTLSVLGLTLQALALVTLFLGLLALSVIDLRHRIIPNQILIWLLLFGILFEIAAVNPAWQQRGLGLVTGVSLFAAVRWLGTLRAGREAMGMGDVKLAGVIGWYLGSEPVIAVLFLASLIASLSAPLWWLIHRKPISELEIPFGPFLSLAALIIGLWGEALWQFYRGIAGF